MPLALCREHIVAEHPSDNIEIFRDDLFSLFLEYSSYLLFDESCIYTEEFHEKCKEIGILILIGDIEGKEDDIFPVSYTHLITRARLGDIHMRKSFM